MSARRAMAACLGALLLVCTAAGAAAGAAAAANEAAGAGGVPERRRAGARRALAQSPPLPDADEGVDSFCNPANSNYTTKPLPCTQQQEADALAQLAEDSASPGDFAVLADNSTCNATDAYSEPVDLMDPDLLEVVWEVASEYAQQSEFWQAACQGDLMSDAYNACRQPDDGNGTTEGTHYQVQMKLGCALGSDDTIALQAEAWLLKDADGGNVTVSEVEWVEIPLPTDPTQ